jgi:predicted phage tail protein
MLRKIKLYGELAKFVGHKEFEVKADSLSHAVSFLINNFEGIEKYMSPKHYQVKVGDYAVDESELCHPIGQEDIHFIPVIAGAGRGIGKILLGAALIGLAFFVPASLGGGLKLSAGIKTGFGFANAGFLAKSLVYVGASLALSGVSDLLFPLPKFEGFESEEDPRLSFNFNGIQQTSRAGTPVPIVYGEIFTGSVVISASVDTEQVQA